MLFSTVRQETFMVYVYDMNFYVLRTAVKGT